MEGTGGSLNLDGVVDGASGEDGRVGAEVNAGGAYRCKERGREVAGIETVLVEQNKAVVAGVECGKEASQICRSECADGGRSGGRRSLQGNVGLERNADAGEVTKAVEEGGIEREDRREIAVGEGCGDHGRRAFQRRR